MPGRNREKDQRMSAALKAAGEERTTGRCTLCYTIISCDGPKSKYNHKCGVSKKDKD